MESKQKKIEAKKAKKLAQKQIQRQIQELIDPDFPPSALLRYNRIEIDCQFTVQTLTVIQDGSSQDYEDSSLPIIIEEIISNYKREIILQK